MIKKGSRYTNIPTYYPKNGKGRLFIIRERVKYDTTEAKYHTWTQSDTLDFLAYKLYGDSQLWWVLLDANPQYQSELDIKVGDLLLVPPYKQAVKTL